MSKGLNKVQLIGNLGVDPRVTVFDNGGKVASLSVATTDSYKNVEGNWVEFSDWHNVVVNGKLVDTVERCLKKGSRVYVEGKLKTRNYEKDGQVLYVTEVRVSDIVFLDKVG